MTDKTKQITAIFSVKVQDIDKEEVVVNVPVNATEEEIDAIVSNEYSQFVGDLNTGGWSIKN